MLKKSSLIIAIFLFALLGGCQPQTVPTLPAASPTIPSLPSPTSTVTPSPTHTPTPAPCTETNGKIITINIPTERLSLPVDTNIYLPPCYDPNRSEKYPVLYMLHGQAAENEQWIDLGLTTAADELIAQKTIQPMIIVMPWEISWRLGPLESQYTDVLIEDVLPYIQAHYTACDQRTCRALGGLSRGGNWAVYIAFQHPDVFSAIGAHSAPLFYGEIGRIDTSANNFTSTSNAPSFFVDVGNKDPEKQQVLDLVEALKVNGVPYDFYQFEGRHDETYWSAHVSDYLTWYSSQFNEGNFAPPSAPMQ